MAEQKVPVRRPSLLYLSSAVVLIISFYQPMLNVVDITIVSSLYVPDVASGFVISLMILAVVVLGLGFAETNKGNDARKFAWLAMIGPVLCLLAISLKLTSFPHVEYGTGVFYLVFSLILAAVAGMFGKLSPEDAAMAKAIASSIAEGDVIPPKTLKSTKPRPAVCTNCGHKLERDSLFCTECGITIESAAK